MEQFEVNRSSELNDEALSQINHLLIADSSSSTLTVDRSSGLGNDTCFEQTQTVETDANKLTNEEIEEMPKLIETPEPVRSTKKFNLRKSLAWDSAFFTSDGVLDADELSTMIEGGDKGVKHCLPGIEEEVYRSMESISTLESDSSLSLDCLEAELFQDIRASIQNSNRSFNLDSSSIKLSSGKTDSQANISGASKNADLDSGKRLKFGAKTKDINNTSSIPKPKIISRVNLNTTSALTKRATLSANHGKDQDTAKLAHVTQKGTQAAKTTTQVSKLTRVVVPRRGVPKPLLSASSLGTSTALKTDPARPSSSCSNSSSCSSGTDVKVRSSANISRKKVDARTGKLTTTSTIPQMPSRINMKNKLPCINSNLSSSISPASSISEWSSKSLSSSTSTINRKSAQSDLSIHPTDRISSKKGNQSVAVPPSQTQSGSVSRPAVQLTGLRMPSPKIGFFDVGKSGARTPNRSIRSQSKLPTGPPKPGVTHDSQSSSNGVKCGKIPPPKTFAAATNMKPNTQKITPKKSQQQQTSQPETKTSPVTSDASDHICIKSSHNMGIDANKQPELGSNGHKVLSNECFVVTKDDKMDKFKLTEGSRTPFAVKNSVSDTDMVVTEKTVNFSFQEGQQNENSELGTKTNTFRLEGHTWQCTSGLSGDVTVEIGGMSFHLHKFPLITRSGLLTKLIGDYSNEDEHVCIVHLDEIPGGSKTFELIARFCYDIKVEVTAHNVISLRCAAEWLEMTDEYGEENLITLTENFLIEVFGTWADTMKALESCEEVLHDAEELFLVSRCITSLAQKACMGFNYDEKTPTSTIWNGILTTNKPVTTCDDWWHKDVSFLSLHLYKRVIRAIASRGMKPEIIAGSLVGYLKRYIPLLNRELGFNDANYCNTVSPSEVDQRNLFEDIVELFPNQKGIIDTTFLGRLLRTGMILHVSPSCQENLEKRVGAQLDSAVLEDVLIPNQGFNTVETLYDIDCFQRILEYFMTMHQPPSAVCSPCIVEEGFEEGSGAQSLEAITSVANLVDGFLADVAADVNLKLPTFQSLAASVPDYAHQASDGIYRAIDIYLKAHPWLSDFEREQLCRLMNVQKLSVEASTHAARNERLPMRVIVQVIFFEQLRIRTSISGWFYVSENEGGEVVERGGLGGGGRAGMGEMRERVIGLERDCETMKFEIRKMVKNKRSWNFFCKRKSKKI
ncbi:hypothetical protein QVD17_14748 [Tagetes erecta]|uniref:BTB/POZ domain-containing protein n=1 Tax=Tagetes erecta TaxID=13708 RepID=A0AAD8KN04_TARER|nr:hypothetical protein QVD17_14748 [Tagetes erecta]